MSHAFQILCKLYFLLKTGHLNLVISMEIRFSFFAVVYWVLFFFVLNFGCLCADISLTYKLEVFFSLHLSVGTCSGFLIPHICI